MAHVEIGERGGEREGGALGDVFEAPGVVGEDAEGLAGHRPATAVTAVGGECGWEQAASRTSSTAWVWEIYRLTTRCKQAS